MSQICFNFSFVGFKSIFVLYAFHHLNVAQQDAIQLFAILMTLSYASSLLGGYLSDKLLNPRRCQLIGGTLCVLSMATFLYNSQQLIYLAMALLSVGSGCLKPNNSALLASFFKDPQDPAKDIAFTHFYLCMNVGNFSGPVVCSFISQYCGWISGLMTIALSFSTGTLLLFYGLRHHQILKPKLKSANTIKAGLILGLSLATFCYLLQSPVYRSSLMAIVVIVSLVAFCIINMQCRSQERRDLYKTMGYILCFALFCSIFEQVGSTIMLFLENAVDRQVFNTVLPAASLLALNPIYVLILGLILPKFTKSCLEKKRPLSSMTKLSLGFFFISLSFAVFALVIPSTPKLVPLSYIFIIFLFQTVGELYIVPITLSNITKDSPPRYLSLMLSFWLLAIGYGHYLASILARVFLGSVQKTADQNLSNYQGFFTKIFLMSLTIALTLGLFSYYQSRIRKNQK